MGRLYLFSKLGGDEQMPKSATKKVTIHNVAKYFLSRVDLDAGSSMTPLKLQKLCYYAQAWNLVFNKERLFAGIFEAWAHGPVCPSLWRKYNHYGWHEIPPITDFNYQIFNEKQAEVLEAIWDAYGQYDGKYLEDLTHQEEPWLNARVRAGVKRGEPCNEPISEREMSAYYSKLLEEYGEEQ